MFIVGAGGGVESSTIISDDGNDTFPAVSVAFTERLFVAFWFKFTDIEKFPPVATPVAVEAPPVMVIVEPASAVPVIAMESAFTI